MFQYCSFPTWDVEAKWHNSGSAGKPQIGSDWRIASLSGHWTAWICMMHFLLVMFVCLRHATLYEAALTQNFVCLLLKNAPWSRGLYFFFIEDPSRPPSGFKKQKLLSDKWNYSTIFWSSGFEASIVCTRRAAHWHLGSVGDVRHPALGGSRTSIVSI